MTAPTIAELQINLDARPIDQGVKSLNSLADASERVTKAINNQKNAQNNLNTGGGLNTEAGPGGSSKKVDDLSAAIDFQTKKLKALDEQRKSLNSSNLKVTNPAEFTRLNQIIDSNIELVNRQGNAMSRLAVQAERERTLREQSAQAEQRRLEAQERAVQSNEATVARAEVRQKQQLDSTLAGLSAQIKAQQEYNRTVEQLNHARATGGMGGESGAMSSAEYDSYLKLAQARRDAAFATKDESAQMERAQSKIDSVTASLGRAERAEVQYTRALSVLNDGLKLGVLSADQYAIKLQQIGERRDTAIQAANDNSAAEARFVRQLNQVATAYDPVMQAQQRYGESTRILAQGLQSGKITTEQFNKALGEHRVALEGVKNAQPDSSQSMSKEYQAALDRLLPYNAQLRNLAEAERVLQQQQAAGKVTTDQQIKSHQQATEAIKAERAEIERRIDAGRRNANSAKQDAAALRSLPAQFTDIVVSLQGGQAPLTVLLQQGGQIKDMFGGVMPALQAVGGAIVRMANPVTVLAAAVLGLGVAWNTGSKEMVAFEQAITSSRNAAGVSTGEFSKMQDSLDDLIGTSRKAAEAMTLMAGTGRISGDVFEKVAAASITFEKATGTALKDIIADFASLGKDPVQAAITLDEKYRFLTSATLAQAQALVEQGKEQEAVNLLQTEMATATEDAGERMIDQLNLVGKALAGLKAGFAELIDGIVNIGRASTTMDEINKKQAEIAAHERAGQTNRFLLMGLGKKEFDEKSKQLDKELKQLQQRQGMEQHIADQEAKRENDRKAAISSQDRLARAEVEGLDKVTKAERDREKVIRDIERVKTAAANDGRARTADEVRVADAALANADRKLKEARESAKKTKVNPLETQDVQEIKSNLNLITSEYENAYKKATALGEANIISQEAMYNQQKSILTQQSKDVAAEYDKQIEAIQKLQGQKGNSASQSISLDNQLIKAETAKAETMAQIDSKLEQLQAKENGRIAERERNISSYREALEAQLRATQAEGERAVNAVGRGDRQATVNEKLAEADRSFADRQRELAEALGREDMDSVEYAQKLKDLEQAHTAMKDQIVKNDKDIMAANYEWTNGMTAAVENAHDQALDFAGTVESALTGAFNSAGDALAEFVTTGKLNFKDFATSVMSDMAAMAAKQAAMGAMSALFQVGMAAFGGPASAATAAASASSSGSFGQIGNSYQSNVFQAKGGAWNAGTQYFAQGGAFTNSVVSNPTSFGMNNGSRGIMGEAGPEAIVPLARTRNGDLGVRMMGDAGGGGNATIVNVNVVVNESGSTSTTDGGAGYDQFGQNLAGFVRQEIYTVINTETRPGGSLQAQG